MLSLCLGLGLRHSLSISGGNTDSIFPAVERWLNDDADHYEALQFLACRKDMDRYQSVIDFIFCEVNPETRRRCFAYYDGKGPAAREIYSEAAKARYEAHMLRMLRLAYAAFCEKRRLSWSGALAIIEHERLAA
jgi:hypothetical protein